MQEEPDGDGLGQRRHEDVGVDDHIVEAVAERGADREWPLQTRPFGLFLNLRQAAHQSTSGPEQVFLTARRLGNLRLLTTPNQASVTAALPLHPVGKEKSPGIPVSTRFSGLFPWRYRWDLNPRWSCPHTCFRDMILRPLGHGTESECRPCDQSGPKATERALPLLHRRDWRTSGHAPGPGGTPALPGGVASHP